MIRRFSGTKASVVVLLLVLGLIISGGLASGVTDSSGSASAPHSLRKERPDGYQRVVDEMRAWDLKKAAKVLFHIVYTMLWCITQIVFFIAVEIAP